MLNKLDDVIRRVVDSRMQNMHTAIPAVVLSYDAKLQKAIVKPTIKRVYFNDKVIELPSISEVPVVMPYNKVAGVKFPLFKDDSVLLVFSESCLERWLSAKDEIVEEGYSRKFDLSDAIAIPCVYSFAEDQFGTDDEQNNAIFVYKDAKVILFEDGKVVIESKGDAMVTLDGDAMEFKNNADSLLPILSDLAGTLSTSTVDGKPFDNAGDFITLKGRIDSLIG